MDVQGIGMIDYSSFLDVLKKTANGQARVVVSDGFDWEQGVVRQIREWVRNEGLTVEEAFNSFDRDFDGQLSKEDLRWSLINILQVRAALVVPTKLDRLFSLLDFYKCGRIQLSDFQR